MNVTQEPVRDANGRPLTDSSGNHFFLDQGWRAVRDQSGEVTWDADGGLLIEQVDEDKLALMTQEVPRLTPLELSEQVRQLQSELGNTRQCFQSTVGKLEQKLDQSEAQVEADRRAMTGEFEKQIAAHHKTTWCARIIQIRQY